MRLILFCKATFYYLMLMTNFKQTNKTQFKYFDVISIAIHLVLRSFGHGQCLREHFISGERVRAVNLQSQRIERMILASYLIQPNRSEKERPTFHTEHWIHRSVCVLVFVEEEERQGRAMSVGIVFYAHIYFNNQFVTATRCSLNKQHTFAGTTQSCRFHLYVRVAFNAICTLCVGECVHFHALYMISQLLLVRFLFFRCISNASMKLAFFVCNCFDMRCTLCTVYVV